MEDGDKVEEAEWQKKRKMSEKKQQSISDLNKKMRFCTLCAKSHFNQQNQGLDLAIFEFFISFPFRRHRAKRALLIRRIL